MPSCSKSNTNDCSFSLYVTPLRVIMPYGSKGTTLILEKKGKEGLNSELNVIHVVKTIYEFFLFKKYTLNSKQYLLFETISKPSLNYAEARLGKKSLRTRNYSQKSLNCLSNTKIDNFLEKSCSIQKSRVEK